MSIKDFSKKIKDLAHFQAPSWGALPDDLFLGLIVVLVGFGAFGLGRLSKIEGAKTPIRIENEPAVTADTFAPVVSDTKAAITPGTVATPTDNSLVASKSGTKYYYAWCSGAQRISPANLVHFATADDAKAAGYTPSSTCKGL